MSIYVDTLIKRLNYEMKKQDRSGIYALTQRKMAYNSNKIEGSTLTEEQTASIFTTGTLTVDGTIRNKDIEETSGHFAMFNYMLQTLDTPLSSQLIKTFHFKLKSGVWEDVANGYAVGEYKQRANQVGGIQTAKPSEVATMIDELLEWYSSQEKTLPILCEFHIRYERIHPFQDGNGRTGRLILFRECLVNGIDPFVIQDNHKMDYYHALQNVSVEKLVELCEKEQAEYKDNTIDFIFDEEEKEKYNF